jgi:alanyl-tRNA synthetase
MELCGGTHVHDSGQIGIFKILSENGVAAGIRRIEAITGQNVYQHLIQLDTILNNIQNIMKSNTNNVIQKLESLNDDHKNCKKELETLKNKLIKSSLDDILSHKININGINLIKHKFVNTDIKDLRSMTDDIKENMSKAVIVFASVNEAKVIFLISVTEDLLGKVHAGKMIKEVAAVAGGGGGGKADMAQAGGKDPSKTDEALALSEKILKNITI